jgi:hypothetical protein
MTQAVIIIPTQGMDVGAFKDVAEEANRKLYNGQAIFLRTKVEGSSEDARDVKIVTAEGGVFNWTSTLNLKTVLIISHAGPFDGPNLSFATGDHLSGYQPWSQLTSKDLARKGIAATESVLSEKGQTFWETVGASLAADGKIILAGCGMGTLDYAKLVAKASGRKVYAAVGAFGAGDLSVAIPAIEAIEKGQATGNMRLHLP